MVPPGTNGSQPLSRVAWVPLACYLAPMFGKLLLTLAVILGAYLVIRSRIQRGRAVAAASPPPVRPGSP